MKARTPSWRSRHSTPAVRVVQILAGLALLYLVVALFQTVSDPKQWDLAVYRAASRVAADGASPYPPAALAHELDGSHLRFVYPPHVAWSLGAVRSLADHVGLPRGVQGSPVDLLFVAFLLAKLAASAALLCIWHDLLNQPLGDRADSSTSHLWALLILISVVGFRETLLRDLYAGNVAVFEQLALWLGLRSLLAGRPYRFALWVAAASVVKGVLGIFLPLVLLCSVDRSDPGRSASRRGRAFAALALGLALLLLLPVLASLLGPHSLAEWADSVAALDERGRMNPSSWALLRDLTEQLPSGEQLATLLWLLGSVATLGVTVRAALRSDRGPGSGRIHAVLLTTTAAALILPRFKDYSYLMLVPAAVYAALLLRPALRFALLAALTIALWQYQPLFVAAAIWGFLISTRPPQHAPPANGTTQDPSSPRRGTPSPALS